MVLLYRGVLKKIIQCCCRDPFDRTVYPCQAMISLFRSGDAHAGGTLLKSRNDARVGYVGPLMIGRRGALGS